MGVGEGEERIWLICGLDRKKEMKMAEMMTEQARMTSNCPKRRGIGELYTRLDLDTID